MKARVVWILGAVLFLCFVCSIIQPGGNGMSKARIGQLKSASNLCNIAYFVGKYKSDHAGSAPTSLTKLVPYADGDLEEFYVPNKLKSEMPADWTTNASRIETDSGYVLVSDTNSKFVVFEKPGLWPDGSIGVGFSDGTVRRVSYEDFTALENSQIGANASR
jgi:hypothetical protein